MRVVENPRLYTLAFFLKSKHKYSLFNHNISTKKSLIFSQVPTQTSFQKVSSFLIKILPKNDTEINKYSSIFSVKSFQVFARK